MSKEPRVAPPFGELFLPHSHVDEVSLFLIQMRAQRGGKLDANGIPSRRA